MISCGKSIVCLLLICLIVRRTASIDINKVCAHRCLMHQGGILCNCNAMHFNGKRSDPTQNQLVSDLYAATANQEPPNIQGEFLEDNPNFSSSESSPTDALQFHERPANMYTTDELRDDNGDNDWDEMNLDKYLASLRHQDDLEATDISKAGTGDYGGLPLLMFPSNVQGSSDGAHEVSKNTRAEVVSRVRQIMRAAVTSQEGLDNEILPLPAQRGVSVNNLHKGDNLMRLEHVLMQALEGR